MKKIFTLFLALSAYTAAFAQEHHNHLHPCGTSPQKIEWLQEYQRNPSAFAQYTTQRNQSITYLPLSLHLVGRTDSASIVDLESVMNSFCQLNLDYEASNIQFYIQFPIHYHYNSDWFNHATVREGGAMMLQENIPNTINVYFVASPAGNCGYNLPYAGIAMSAGCLNGHTFAHEMGHALSLPHTFLGWEGGADHTGDITPDFSNPAPTTVTYDYTDFKNERFTNDTLIVDLAYVENVARTGADKNCDFAADGFCDTPADYLAYRWLCSSNNAMSSETQIDPTGVTFQSNGWNIMTYAYDECQVGFSNEQINAMHAFIQTNRQDYIPAQVPNYLPITTQADLLYPAANDTLNAEQPYFVWSAVPNATHYYVEIYREPYTPQFIVGRFIVADTTLSLAQTIPPSIAAFPYAWRVRAFNPSYTCTSFNLPVQFRTKYVPLSIDQLQDNQLSMKIQPNPVHANTGFQFIAESHTAQSGKLQIFNALGQKVFMQNMDLEIGETIYYIEGNIFAGQSGLFFAQWQSNKGEQKTIRLIVE